MGRPASARRMSPPPSRAQSVFLGLFPSSEGPCRDSLVRHTALRVASPTHLLVADVPSPHRQAACLPASHPNLVVSSSP